MNRGVLGARQCLTGILTTFVFVYSSNTHDLMIDNTVGLEGIGTRRKRLSNGGEGRLSLIF
jgi:hypothetical protein